jgi:hypothetical protein
MGQFTSQIPFQSLSSHQSPGILLSNFASIRITRIPSTATTIRFTIGGVAALSGALSSGVEGPLSSHVKLTVFDLLGREVATLVNDQKAPGEYTVQWDASNVASSVYLYRLQAGSFVETRKCVVLR